MTKKSQIAPTLTNPFEQAKDVEFTVPGQLDYDPGLYETTLMMGHELLQLPYKAAGVKSIQKQHQKKRMTVWERIQVLKDPGTEPKILYQNWGKNLDGASLVTGIIKVNGRDVAIYGHDFTVRAGSMDATNGSKLARLFELAGKLGIPLVGMNDSAGAFIPAGVGGLDGYAEAFTALRRQAGEFIREESEWVPHPIQVEDFYREVEDLALRAEKLELRLKQLRQRVHATRDT